MAVDAAPVLVVGRDEGGVFEPGTILGDEGFQVTTAASIAEAVEAPRSEDFALVVVDVVEPQGHCGEIVRRVRQLTDAPSSRSFPPRTPWRSPVSTWAPTTAC